MPDLILASASPRRCELLKQLGLKFTVRVSDLEEKVDPALAPGPLVESLARSKARNVAAAVRQGIVIGADTVVVHEDIVLGKPADSEEAATMLRRLSGKTHRVLTGVVVLDAESGRELAGHEVTRVRFRDLSEREITSYIACGEPADKAGAYAIQGLGAIFVLGIEGCYFNVVGLPLTRLAGMLGQFGITVV